MISITQGLKFFRREVCQIHIASSNHRCNHALQAHALPVFWRKNFSHAIVVQIFNFARNNHPTAATKYFNMRSAAFLEQIDHVLEEFDMPALVAAHGDALHVFLNCRGDDFFDRAIVAEMDHFRTHALQNAAHDVNRCVVTVEEAGRRHESNPISQ